MLIDFKCPFCEHITYDKYKNMLTCINCGAQFSLDVFIFEEEED